MLMFRYVTLIRLVYTCVLLSLHETPAHECSMSLVPVPLQHPTSAMTGMIPEEEEVEEESPSPAKKIRKLQNDEEEVCEDMLGMHAWHLSGHSASLSFAAG